MTLYRVANDAGHFGGIFSTLNLAEGEAERLSSHYNENWYVYRVIVDQTILKPKSKTFIGV